MLVRSTCNIPFLVCLGTQSEVAVTSVYHMLVGLVLITFLFMYLCFSFYLNLKKQLILSLLLIRTYVALIFEVVSPKTS